MTVCLYILSSTLRCLDGEGACLTCWLGNRFGLNQVPSQLEHHSRASDLSAEGHVLLTNPCKKIRSINKMKSLGKMLGWFISTFCLLRDQGPKEGTVGATGVLLLYSAG